MSELRELYQEVILDHSRQPRNFRAFDGGSRKAEGYNPLCGDRVTVYLDLEDDTIKDISFQGSGCAISTASASMMTQSLKGKTVAEVEEMFGSFHELVAGKEDRAAVEPRLGTLRVFAGVREFPIRVKCATLAWHTMRSALENKKEPVSTE